MLNKNEVVNMGFKDETVSIWKDDLRLSFAYASIRSLYINNEMDETAREMQVSLKKLKRSEPNLANFLRMNFVVNGVSFSFVVSREDGEPLALHVENEFRRVLMSSDVLPGSLADQLKIDMREDSKEAVYPIYFHGCPEFGEAA